MRLAAVLVDRRPCGGFDGPSQQGGAYGISAKRSRKRSWGPRVQLRQNSLQHAPASADKMCIPIDQGQQNGGILAMRRRGESTETEP
jgi:hypothetical protein